MMDRFLDQQKLQFAHDAANHQDIHCLSRIDRLKHYGLHYAKYCGRLSREDLDHSRQKTMVDWMLVVLSAANALQDNLTAIDMSVDPTEDIDLIFRRLCDASGRFCDGCEKIDHLESFRDIVVKANRDLIGILANEFERLKVDLPETLQERRSELRARAFYSMS